MLSLEFVTDCVHSNAAFVDRQMATAKEVSKRGKWANLLVRQGDWDTFDVKEDYATSLYVNAKYLIFQHSQIEYFYLIHGRPRP